jgi:hypothetical protein
MIVGGIALVAVIVLVIALLPKGGDDDANRHVQMPTMPPPKTTAKADQGPKRLPPPKLPSGLHDKARDIVEQAKPLAEQSDAAYKEALEAKEAGNVELYQEKLREAATLLGGINDLWNELIIEIDQNFTNNDWDAEQVANHYFAGESATIMKYLKLSQEINKQRAIR